MNLTKINLPFNHFSIKWYSRALVTQSQLTYLISLDAIFSVIYYLLTQTLTSFNHFFVSLWSLSQQGSTLVIDSVHGLPYICYNLSLRIWCEIKLQSIFFPTLPNHAVWKFTYIMRMIFIVTPGYKKVEADMNKQFFYFIDTY